MKNGMHYPLIGLFILLAVAIIGDIWNGAQVEISTTRMTAEAVGTELPRGWMAFGEIGASWVIKAILGSVLTGAGAALAIRAWEAWKKNKRKSSWTAGPNANYQRQSASQKAPSDSDIYKLMLYQQMAQNGTRPKMSPQNGIVNDDEPEIVF